MEYRFPGDHIPGVPPVPIPNTAVKPRVANGSRTTGPARVGCCQVYGPNTVKTVFGPFCFPNLSVLYRLGTSALQIGFAGRSVVLLLNSPERAKVPREQRVFGSSSPLGQRWEPTQQCAERRISAGERHSSVSIRHLTR
jgi:hypothetical protein